MVGGVPLNRGKASRGPVRHEGIVRVPTVDFARFLRERYCVEDNVLLKLDIEGAEFELLEHVRQQLLGWADSGCMGGGG